MTAPAFDPTKVRLGKHLGVVEDPRTLRFARYLLPAALPPIPGTVNVTKKIPADGWPMLGNDDYGDCTCASSGHRLLADSTREGHPITVTKQDALDLYALVNGGQDNGAYMLDVANALRTHGIAGHKIGAFVRISPAMNWDGLKLGMKLFGGAWLGIALPITAQHQAKWDVVGDGNTGDSAPGSWGGHAVYAGWITHDHLDIVTWAHRLRMTKRFAQRYVDEAYLMLDPAWLGADKKSPQGVDLATLTADLAQITA